MAQNFTSNSLEDKLLASRPSCCWKIKWNKTNKCDTWGSDISNPKIAPPRGRGFQPPPDDHSWMDSKQIARMCCPLKWHRQIVYMKSSRTRTITLNRRACLAGNTSNGTLPRNGTSRCTCRCMVLPFSYPVILCNRFRSLKFSTDTSNSLLISKIKPKFSVSCEE